MSLLVVIALTSCITEDIRLWSSQKVRWASGQTQHNLWHTQLHVTVSEIYLSYLAWIYPILLINSFTDTYCTYINSFTNTYCTYYKQLLLLHKAAYLPVLYLKFLYRVILCISMCCCICLQTFQAIITRRLRPSPPCIWSVTTFTYLQKGLV